MLSSTTPVRLPAMKVLLTGATGFIGTKLAEKLYTLDHDLIVLSRDSKRAQQAFPFPAEFHTWDGTRDKVPTEILQSANAVIHLAGESVASKRWSKQQKKRIRDSRVLSTQNICESIANCSQPPQVFIVSSGTGIYGEDPGDKVLTESDSIGTDFLAQVCAQWETASNPAGSSVRTVNLRTGLVLGRNAGLLSRLESIFKRGLGGRLGSGRQWMSWIHVDDMVNLIVWAMENPEVSGTINAVAPKPVTNKEFTETLNKQLGTLTAPPAPSFVLKTVLGEMASLALGGQRVIPKRAQDLGFSFSYDSLPEALQALYLPSPEAEIGDELMTAVQFINKPLEEVFPFFSSEKNLEKLTPGSLQFNVVKSSTKELGLGTQIDYKLKIHGIPIRWQSEITHWEPPYSFADKQLRGPYKKWLHLHSFESLRGGTLMRDRVIYKLPLGGIGSLLGRNFVRSDVEDIFRYRFQRVNEVFGA